MNGLDLKTFHTLKDELQRMSHHPDLLTADFTPHLNRIDVKVIKTGKTYLIGPSGTPGRVQVTTVRDDTQQRVATVILEEIERECK